MYVLCSYILSIPNLGYPRGWSRVISLTQSRTTVTYRYVLCRDKASYLANTVTLYFCIFNHIVVALSPVTHLGADIRCGRPGFEKTAKKVQQNKKV